MKRLNRRTLLRHARGGLLCFEYHHPSEATLHFPRTWWRGLIKRIVRALWCAISGHQSTRLLDKSQLKKHARTAFLAFVKDHPEATEVHFGRVWWPSVIKRIVRTLWDDLCEFYGGTPLRSNSGYKCDRCKAAMQNHKIA